MWHCFNKVLSICARDLRDQATMLAVYSSGPLTVLFFGAAKHMLNAIIMLNQFNGPKHVKCRNYDRSTQRTALGTRIEMDE